MRPERATLTGVRVGLGEKLRARVQVGEGSDAQAVGGMELSLQELTAHLTDVHQLEETCGWQQNLGKIIILSINYSHREEERKAACGF